MHSVIFNNFLNVGFLLLTLFQLAIGSNRHIQVNSQAKLDRKDCSPFLSCSSSHATHNAMMMAIGTYSSFFQIASSWTSSDNFNLQLIINSNATCSIESNPFDQILVSEEIQGSGSFGPFTYSSGNYNACVKLVLNCHRPLWFKCTLDSFITSANVTGNWCSVLFGMGNSWSSFC